MRVQKLFAMLGPGIVWAATSIGVSHIVQSTRAGADFGFALIGFIFLAHLVKYPFFLFGPQYAASTGKSLLDGYFAVGRWAFYLFLFFTFATMFFVQAGVTIVTAALAFNLFGDSLTVSQWAALILLVVSVILLVGHYQLLNSSLKWMMLILAVLSMIAWLAAASRLGFTPSVPAFELDLTTPATIAFIVALMGWMPTSVEVSVWHSLWTIARFKTYGKSQAKIAVFDFKIGFFTSFILAIIFVWLGALLMFDQGLSFAASAAAFAGQLVDIYTSALGDWSWLMMAIVTFIALFSTTFAVADGFPQVWKRAFTIARPAQAEHAGKIYTLALLSLLVVAWWIIAGFAKDIKALLDFVTTVSFVSAPVYAWLNYRVVCHAADETEIKPSELIAIDIKPKGWFRLYTLSSLLALSLFSLYYLYWRFILPI